MTGKYHRYVQPRSIPNSRGYFRSERHFQRIYDEIVGRNRGSNKEIFEAINTIASTRFSPPETRNLDRGIIFVRRANLRR